MVKLVNRCLPLPPPLHYDRWHRVTCHYTLFDTPIGRCGIAWRGKYITAVQLPETTPAKTAAHLVRRVEGAEESAPPRWVQQVMDRIAEHLAGEPHDLANIPIDCSETPPFHRAVYAAARTIPAGCTCTYAELAAAAGSPKAARAVGQALARNPFPLIVPCHRIIAADGRLTGFTAPQGIRLKTRLQAIEKTIPVRADHVNCVGE